MKVNSGFGGDSRVVDAFFSRNAEMTMERGSRAFDSRRAWRSLGRLIVFAISRSVFEKKYVAFLTTVRSWTIASSPPFPPPRS